MTDKISEKIKQRVSEEIWKNDNFFDFFESHNLAYGDSPESFVDSELDEWLGFVINQTYQECQEEIKRNYVHKSLITKPNDWLKQKDVLKLVEKLSITQKSECPITIKTGTRFIFTEELKQKIKELGGEDET